MITSKELKLLFAFQNDITRALSQKEMKELTQEKSNHAIQRALKAFKEEKLVLPQEKAHYFLNLSNVSLSSYLELSSQEKLSERLKELIKSLQRELDEVSPFYTLLLFGSYAEGKESKNSDIDLLIILPNEEKKHRYEKNVELFQEKVFEELDPYFCTEQEVLEMLRNKEQNLAKQVLAKHLPLYNSSVFHKLLLNLANEGYRVGDLS